MSSQLTVTVNPPAPDQQPANVVAVRQRSNLGQRCGDLAHRVGLPATLVCAGGTTLVSIAAIAYWVFVISQQNPTARAPF
jgi:hypothetical protein